jgi:hypothetical protein
MTDTMREKIAWAKVLAALLEREGTYSGIWFSDQLVEAAELLALTEPVMEENELIREILTQDELGNPGSLQRSEALEYDKGWRDAMHTIRATLFPKSEKQDG